MLPFRNVRSLEDHSRCVAPMLMPLPSPRFRCKGRHTNHCHPPIQVTAVGPCISLPRAHTTHCSTISSVVALHRRRPIQITATLPYKSLPPSHSRSRLRLASAGPSVVFSSNWHPPTVGLMRQPFDACVIACPNLEMFLSSGLTRATDTRPRHCLRSPSQVTGAHCSPALSVAGVHSVTARRVVTG